MRTLVNFEATSANEGFLAGLPRPEPLPMAIEGGLFGVEVSGPVVPDLDDIASITAEHALQMAALFTEVLYLDRCRTIGVYPESRRRPRNENHRQKLTARLTRELVDTCEDYQSCLDLYEQAFGVEAAQQLDHWVCKACQPSGETDTPKRQTQLFD